MVMHSPLSLILAQPWKPWRWDTTHKRSYHDLISY
jgi:hypothetical protein